MQQAQGRVAPTMQMKDGVPVNDDAGLEHQADVMGEKAQQLGRWPSPPQFPGPVQAVKSSVVQRLVGFEFETNSDLKRPRGMVWDSDTTLVQGHNWRMCPDEINGRDAKIEFKTAPFNVDGPVGAVQAAVNDIANAFSSMTKYIKAQIEPLPPDTYSPLTTLMAKGRRVEVKPSLPTKAKPQVTGGIRVELILDFLQDMASAETSPGRPDLMPGEERKGFLQESLKYVAGKGDEESSTYKEFAGVVVLLSNYVRRFQADKADFDLAITNLKQQLPPTYNAYKDKAERPTEEQLAKKKLDLLAEFEVEKEKLRLQYTPSYAKARASALPRVAFNDLPGVTNKHLLKYVLLAAGLTEGDGGRRMFPLGFKKDPDYARTIAEWIAEIQKARGANEGELWSARTLQAGNVGAGKTAGIGIPFELRALSSDLEYDRWWEFSTPFLSYFRALNEKAKPTKE